MSGSHIVVVAEPSPAVTVVNLSTRGLMSIVVVVPSNQPPNQLVVGMTSGISDKRINVVTTLSRY